MRCVAVVSRLGLGFDTASGSTIDPVHLPACWQEMSGQHFLAQFFSSDFYKSESDGQNFFEICYCEQLGIYSVYVKIASSHAEVKSSGQ